MYRVVNFKRICFTFYMNFTYKNQYLDRKLTAKVVFLFVFR